MWLREGTLTEDTGQGCQLKPVTGGLPPPVGPLTTVCLDFINENKNDINKKKSNTTTMTTEIFKCNQKNPVLWSIKIPINSTLFDAQNAGNGISELLDFKFFWAMGMPL